MNMATHSHSAADNQKEAQKREMTPEQYNEWASSLVGRWFEVYWDPNGDTDEAPHVGGTKPQAPPVHPLPTKTILERPSNEHIELVQQTSQEPQPQIQHINALCTGPRLGLSLQQIHMPHTGANTVDLTVINAISQYRTLQNQTAPLPYILIKAFLPDAVNGHLLQVSDIITGINGNSFYSPEFQQSGVGGDFFNRVVSQLRDAKRPMVVNFHRVVYSSTTTAVSDGQVENTTASIPIVNTTIQADYGKLSEKDLTFPAEPAEDLPQGWVLRRIPRVNAGHKTCDVYYYSPNESYKFRSRPEVSRFLYYLHQANGNEDVAIGLFHDQAGLLSSNMNNVPMDALHQKRKRSYESDAESSLEEVCEDAVDWYDAKILSYTNGEFVVLYLGDDPGVTYTMPLNPEVVRPSVRVWAKRTRALINCTLDLSKDDDYESWEQSFRSSLPPTIESPRDQDISAKSCSQVAAEASGDSIISVGRKKIGEYKRLIALQLHLAKHISPANDETEEEEEEDATSEPGPFITAFQVKALCRYLTETLEACEWLLSEDTGWTLLKCLSTGHTVGSADQTKFSKETLLSLLVNGVRILHRLLRADPALAKNTGGRKRQCFGLTERVTVDASFDSLLQSALVSDVSMDAVMANVTNQYMGRRQNKCVDATIQNLMNQTYNIYQPAAKWIKTSNDIVGEQSQHTYSIDTIERHTSEAEALQFVDVSIFVVKLEAKLSRLQFFEMETWSAIKACIQLNVSRDTITSTDSINVGGSNDTCLCALQRLKQEALVHPLKNVHPLGKPIINAAGVHVPSLLTRAVIDDAITIRLWVLDLTQAKLLRERSSFIEGVIRRFSALPKLPPPPFSFGGFDGNEAQPSAILAENTKDSITILSANCYSYNHIIGNIGANLRSSMNASGSDSTGTHEMQLTTKSGVAAALVELKRLPILSVVEEKLYIRDELIDWNNNAIGVMEASTCSKIPYKQIEDLHNELMNIIDLKSQGRVIVKNLRPSKAVDSELHLFALDDEKVICVATGSWVRDQYKRASEWKKRYDSLIEALESHGFFSDVTDSAEVEETTPLPQINPHQKSSANLISLETINQVCEQYNDNQFASSFPEFRRLAVIREKITNWSSKFHQALTSETLSLQERCNQLANLKNYRLRGVAIEPSTDTICLWIKVFSWPLSVHEKTKSIVGQFESWKSTHQESELTNQAKNAHILNLIKTNLSSLLIEGGQIFLIAGGSPPESILQLRDEAIQFICGGNSNTNVTSLHADRLLSSTNHAKAGLNQVFDLKCDNDVYSSLSIIRVWFWKVMVSGFLRRVNNASDIADINDAKILMALCPRSDTVSSSIIHDKNDEIYLQGMIREADELQGRANAIISHASDLLRERGCIVRKDELKSSMEALASLMSDFDSNSTAATLLRKCKVEEKIAQKVKTLQWLLNTMCYPILWVEGNHNTTTFDKDSDRRIPLNSLQDLYTAIPCQETTDMDAEVVRMITLVKNLVNEARQWEESCRALEDGGKIVDLFSVKAIAQASILSMASLPQENAVHETFKRSLEMKEGLETKLFSDEKPNSHDVYKGKFPDEESLVGSAGDFLLFHFTGSLVYIRLRRALRDLKVLSDQLRTLTAEKAAYLWVVSIYEWIEAVSAAVSCDSSSQLVIAVENARMLLENGHRVMYSVAEEVRDCLALKQISIRPNPQKFSITILKGGAMTSPGGSLLRWASLLFEGLRADVKREAMWRQSAQNHIDSFSYFEAGGKNISTYIEQINELVAESKDMFVRESKVVGNLVFIVDKVMKSVAMKKRLDDEVEAAEKERFDIEMLKYEGPPLVDERYDLLDGLVFRASCVTKDNDELFELDSDDVDSLFAGEQSSRDKSRHFLQKSLAQGFGTFGLENHQDAHDFSNVLAWNLEQAIFDKFKTDETNTSNEYREKVRTLRFNLQDPKNPMLCARVLSGQLKLEDLINMTTDELASKELNYYRQQVQQEATKNIVLSGPSITDIRKEPKSSEVDWAKRVKIDSPTRGTKRLNSPEESPQAKQNILHQPPQVSKLDVPPPPVFSYPMSSSRRDRSTGSSSKQTQPHSSKLEPVISSTKTEHGHHHKTDSGHHITSQSGSESFLINVHRLKLSFTTKLFIEQSCPYQIDNILPSSLSEKGRVTLDEFNKYTSEKMRGGRWNVVHLKLSYITGESDMNAYKRLYKEYESLDRICMINVSDTTKVFLVTPKFLRVSKCMTGVQNLSRSSTYAVVLTKDKLLSSSTS